VMQYPGRQNQPNEVGVMSSRKNGKAQVAEREESAASVRTATYNRVNPVLWDDDKFLELDDLTGKLWLMLLTGPLVTALPGLQRGGIHSLVDVLRRPLDLVEASVRTLHALGMIEIDARRRVIWIPNAPKHNPAESPNHLKAWWNRWNEIPDCPMKFRHVEHLRKYARLEKASHRKVWDQTFGTIELARFPSPAAIGQAAPEALGKASVEPADSPAPTARPVSESVPASASANCNPRQTPAEIPSIGADLGPLFSLAARATASPSEGLPEGVSHSASANASANASAAASAAASGTHAEQPSRAEPEALGIVQLAPPKAVRLPDPPPIVTRGLTEAAPEIAEPAQCSTIERPYEVNGADACVQLRALSQGRLKTTATPQQAVIFGQMVTAMARQHERADLIELLGAYALAGGFDWMTQRRPTLAWLLERDGANLTDSIEQSLEWEAKGRGPVRRSAAPGCQAMPGREAFEADVAERERTGPINYAEYSRKRAAALEVRE